jgi:nucleoside 2-deoxyribosyltransferase
MDYFYVISAVGTDPQFAAKQAILKELGAGYHCEPFFPLERRSRFVMTTCRADIKNAHFVLADLSLERPSCYFELGVAEALDVPTAIIAAAGTRIHQVEDAQRVSLYATLDDYRSLVAAKLSGARRGAP